MDPNPITDPWDWYIYLHRNTVNINQMYRYIYIYLYHTWILWVSHQTGGLLPKNHPLKSFLEKGYGTVLEEGYYLKDAYSLQISQLD